MSKTHQTVTVAPHSGYLDQKCPVKRQFFQAGEAIIVCLETKGALSLEAFDKYGCPFCHTEPSHTTSVAQPGGKKRAYGPPYATSIPISQLGIKRSTLYSAVAILIGIALTIGMLAGVVYAIILLSTRTQNVQVSANASWTPTGIEIGSGSIFYVELISGNWTVDRYIYAPVGPEGYSPELDSKIWGPAQCKILLDAPYGALLGRIGDTSVFRIETGRIYSTNGSGQLYLAMNDSATCIDDNAGVLNLKLSYR